MKSEVFKQAALDLGDGRTHTADVTDEEDDTDSLSFYRTSSFGQKDTVSIRCSVCPADEAASPPCSRCTVADGRSFKRGVRRERGGPVDHRIRWADDCHKELTRQHPRKKYARRPAQPPPLKSILKGT